MNPWRPLIALGVSLAMHVGVAGVVVGTAVWKGWRLTKNVDIELMSTKVEEVKALPLGPPPPPRASGAEAAARRRARARARAAAEEGVKVVAQDGGSDGGADGGTDAGPTPDGGATDAGPPGPRTDAAGPRPRDLREYGPEGSRLTALLRLDRLRTGPQAATTMAVVDQLLRRLPDRRRLIDGTGLDLYRDFDALLVATPNPMDDAVTFLAVRHRLTDEALMAALGRGAEAAGRPIAWRQEGGRPVGTRRSRRSIADGGVPITVERDDRILVLPQPGLAIIAPPAYAALLLPQPGRRDGGAGSEQRWRELVARIDAEDGALPDGAVLMMTASNLLGAGRRGRAGAPTPELTGPAGLTLPPFASAVVGIDPRPFLETTAEFERTADARAWETRWPGLKQTLLGSPLLLLSGFGAIVARAEIQREDATLILRTTGTHEELRRVLGTIAQLLGGGR